MHNFFKGWRRKIGVVTLVMACVFSVGWIDSLTYFREIKFFENEDDFILWTVLSQRGNLTVVREQFGSFTGKVLPGGQMFPFYTDGPVEQSDKMNGVPYWSIVVPLTLLSAWLLLSKPRPAKPPTDSLS